MLYKGKRDGIYFYELTESDLIWDEPKHKHYRVGNVLLFTDKKQIALGLEQVKADDLATAYDYLDGNIHESHSSGPYSPEAFALLKEQLERSEAHLQQRDDLLRDLSADLESQRNSNQVLIAQLEHMREQISIEKISRDEVIDDLEVASAETFRKDQELQETLEAKTQLEQELAARICELLELDSANSDLQKRLQEQVMPENQAPSPSVNSSEGSMPTAQILTSTSGKQIHVYHEFPSSKAGIPRRAGSSLGGLLRVIGFILLALLIFVLGSVVATAALNDISLGEALDTTLSILSP